MRVDNIREPQARVDVTKVFTEDQTQTLGCHSDPITPSNDRCNKEKRSCMVPVPFFFKLARKE